MKNKDNKKMVDKLRKIRDKVSGEIKDMSLEQSIEYLNRQKALHPVMKKEQALEGA